MSWKDGAEGVRGYIKGGGREADGWIRGRGVRTAKMEQGGVRAVACRGWTARAVPPWDAFCLGALRSKRQKAHEFPFLSGYYFFGRTFTFAV